MRKSIFCLVVLLLSFSCVNQNKKVTVISIGAILPLTGDYASAGKNTQMGIDLAIEKINNIENFKNKKIKVIYEDTKGDPKLGVSAVNKLMDVDKVSYIIDNSISSVTLAVAPVVEKRKVVLLATGASSPKISEAGEYIFRIWNSDDLEGEVIAGFASDSLNLSRIGVFFIQNEYGIGLKDAFIKNIPEDYILISESFMSNKTDYSSQIVKIIEKRIEALYLIGYSQDCITIINQLVKFKFNGILLGTSVMLDKNVTDVIEKEDIDLYYPIPLEPDSTQSSVKEFQHQFQEKYNSSPVPLADVGYDAVMLLHDVLKNENDLNANTIKTQFERMENFKGASGVINFDNNGDVHKPIKIKKL